MNDIQETLFKEIEIIQKEVVYSSLVENAETESLLFEITYDMIFKLFEVFDGYRNTKLNLDIVDKDSNHSININNNLHDLCSKYLNKKCE